MIEEVTGLVQGTRERGEVQQSLEEGASLLLGIDGVRVVAVAQEGEGVTVVEVVTDDPSAAACPRCGVVSTSLKGRAASSVRDVPFATSRVRLVWRKSRWRCREDACGTVTFTESLPAIPARARLTARVKRLCGKGIADSFANVLAGAVHYRVSWRTAHQAFIDHVDGVEAAIRPETPPVTVLGIDETRRGKQVWAWDRATGRWRVVADRWLTGIVDAHGTAGLLGHVQGRCAEKVAEWLTAQPQHWRDGVTHVAIDLSTSYAKAVTQALPHAVLVADRFHLVRLANDMVTDARQQLTRQVRGRRGRKQDPEWAARRRLLTARERLSPAAFARMWNQLVDEGDLGVQLLEAYIVKEALRDLLDLAPAPGTSVPNRSEISHRLFVFNSWAAASDLTTVHRLAATIETWWPAIESAILTGYHNARSEGYNRLGKHQGRNAFGFRNTTNQNRRIRWACTRQHRRAGGASQRFRGPPDQREDGRCDCAPSWLRPAGPSCADRGDSGSRRVLCPGGGGRCRR